MEELCSDSKLFITLPVQNFSKFTTDEVINKERNVVELYFYKFLLRYGQFMYWKINYAISIIMKDLFSILNLHKLNVMKTIIYKL